jgi:hypothetical protein
MNETMKATVRSIELIREDKIDEARGVFIGDRNIFEQILQAERQGSYADSFDVEGSDDEEEEGDDG